MKDTPNLTDSAASLFKRAFGGHVGFYGSLLEKHVTNLDLWDQVLADEKRDFERAKENGDLKRVRVPWLIEQYQRMQRSIREIETPPDCLTTHRTPTIDPGEQSPVSLAVILANVEAVRLAELEKRTNA